MAGKLSKSLIAFILISFLLHLSLWKGLNLFRSQKSESNRPKVEVVIVDKSEQKPRPPTKDSLSQQIVEQNKQPLNDELPDQARFLSQHNQRVQEETRAQATGKFSNLAQPGTPQVGDTDGEKREEITKNHKRSKGGHLPDLSSLKPDFSLTPDLRVTPPELPPGRPSQTDDYLKDTKLGIQTLLSTKEFVYYSYYNRIKEKIRQHWEPTIRENVRMAIRRGRSIASTRDRVTRVLITLDKDGTLLQVQVLGESGIVELDEAAVQAFREAAPFPNPPQGMIEQDGYIRIRWDFILEASSNYRLQHELEELKEENFA